VTLTKEFLRQLPKAELHVHLDGCLRPGTMLDLAAEAGISLPADTEETLGAAMLVKHAKSLEEYLERYVHTLAVMQTPAALERIAYEFIIDVAAENVQYVEVRYCPALHPEMSLEEAVDAPLRGIQRAEKETGCRAQLIICGLRTLPPSVSMDLAHVAVNFAGNGVAAFDLAGAEAGYPASEHAGAFKYAAKHGLFCTCHAGEGEGPSSVREALDACCAQRIGHGTRIYQDAQLEERILNEQIPLEICLTSNLHTGTVSDVAEHPARRYFDLGCVVTLNTDGRLMDGISLTDEYHLAHETLGFNRAEIDQLILNAFNSAFLPDEERKKMVANVTRQLGSIK
jgi:adenosine deaminase